MIKINYKKYSEDDLDKARKILGIGSDFKIEDRVEANKQIAQWWEDGKAIELEEALNLDSTQLHGMLTALAKGWAGMGSSSKDEITLTALGSEGSEKLGAVMAHEMGHVQTHLERPDIMAQDDNSIMRELIAVYYAFLTQGDRGIFNKSLEILKNVYDLTAKTKPEILQGMTFSEMKSKAQKIAKQDLGAATPEQRAIKRQGKRKRNGGSGSYTGLKGIRS